MDTSFENEIEHSDVVLRKGEPGVALLQARARGMLARLEFCGIKGWLAQEQEFIVDLQSRIRGHLIRRTHDERARHYRENMDKVIKIQSLVRARQQGEAYKSLSISPLLNVLTCSNWKESPCWNNQEFRPFIE